MCEVSVRFLVAVARGPSRDGAKFNNVHGVRLIECLLFSGYMLGHLDSANDGRYYYPDKAYSLHGI